MDTIESLRAERDDARLNYQTASKLVEERGKQLHQVCQERDVQARQIAELIKERDEADKALRWNRCVMANARHRLSVAGIDDDPDNPITVNHHIDTLTAQRDTLKADNERLKGERDRFRAALEEAKATASAATNSDRHRGLLQIIHIAAGAITPSDQQFTAWQCEKCQRHHCVLFPREGCEWCNGGAIGRRMGLQPAKAALAPSEPTPEQPAAERSAE